MAHRPKQTKSAADSTFNLKKMRVWLIVIISLVQRSAPLSNSLKPWCEALIDYSKANEYVRAHYKTTCDDDDGLDDPYFCLTANQRDAIYNARDGYWDDGLGCRLTPSLENCGFMLCSGFDAIAQGPSTMSTKTVDEIFLPKIRSMIQEQGYPETTISDMIFWNAVIRSKDAAQTRPENESTMPTAGYAALPHIDLDVNAYRNLDELFGVIEKNQICPDDSSLHQQRLQDVKSRIENGGRFAIVNAWINLDPQHPVTDSPLAFLSTKYPHQQKPFPHSCPDMNKSRWYIYPAISHSEVLLFCQYDRDERAPSDLWHCAIDPIHEQNGLATESDHGSGTTTTRISLDVRCFIVFDETVKATQDRFHSDRPRSILSINESREFCSKQSARLRAQQQKSNRHPAT